MNIENQVLGLIKLSDYIKAFLAKKPEDHNEDDGNIELLLKRSEIKSGRNRYFLSCQIISFWNQSFLER